MHKLFIVFYKKREENDEYYYHYFRFWWILNCYFNYGSTRSKKKIGMGIFNVWYVVGIVLLFCYASLIFYLWKFFYYLLDIDRNGYIEKKEMKKIMDVRIKFIVFCFIIEVWTFIVFSFLFLTRLFMIFWVKKREVPIHRKWRLIKYFLKWT